MASSICIISLILQSVVSNFVPVTHSFLNPLFALCALVMIYPYFQSKNKYLAATFIYGVCYDILFSELILIHAFLFFIIGCTVLVLNHLWNNHLISNILFVIINIALYRFLYYFLISIIEKVAWNSRTCLSMIGSSLILNIIYIVLLYFVVQWVSKKLEIHKNY